MTRSIAAVALVLATSTAGAALSGCAAGPHPFVRKGDANSVEVTYSGDVASALPVASEYCARYERVPELLNAGADLAIFNCVHR
jgi:hypothetical protein